MNKKLLIFVMLPVLLTGCSSGVSEEVYNKALSEKNEMQIELDSLKEENVGLNIKLEKTNLEIAITADDKSKEERQRLGELNHAKLDKKVYMEIASKYEELFSKTSINTEMVIDATELREMFVQAVNFRLMGFVMDTFSGESIADKEEYLKTEIGKKLVDKNYYEITDETVKTRKMLKDRYMSYFTEEVANRYMEEVLDLDLEENTTGEFQNSHYVFYNDILLAQMASGGCDIGINFLMDDTILKFSSYDIDNKVATYDIYVPMITYDMEEAWEYVSGELSFVTSQMTFKLTKLGWRMDEQINDYY